MSIELPSILPKGARTRAALQTVGYERFPTRLPSATNEPDDQQQDQRTMVALMIAATIPKPRWMPN